MGNECCSSRQKKQESDFSEKEREGLQELYNELTLVKTSNENNEVTEIALRKLFPENPHLGELLYAFIKGYSGEQHITYETFERALEVLIKGHDGYKSKELAYLEKVDILALMYLKNIFLLQDDLKQIRIEYSEAYDFVETILRIFYYNNPNKPEIDRVAVQSVLDSVFSRYQLIQIDWWTFLTHIKKNLLFANRSLQSYFAAKFLKKAIRLQTPILSTRSFLLNKDQLSLIFLSNMYIHNVNVLERLCSFKYTSSSFETLVQALKEYDAPTILLFKVSTLNNQHKDIPDQEEQTGVIGAFNFSLWKSDGFYHGNSGCYLFNLTPKFRVFLPNDTKSANSGNYTYLNASPSYNANIGVGFGGTLERGFRLWVDGRDPSKSYARAEDDSYQKGPLVDTINGAIRVDYVEVWGLGTELAFLTDSNYLENDELITRKSWVTLNKAKNIQNNTASPEVTRRNDSNRKFSSMAKSAVSAYSDHEDQDTYQYQTNLQYRDSREQRGTNFSQEKEKRAVYTGSNNLGGRNAYTYTSNHEVNLQDSPLSKVRASYSKENSYFNPFKQSNDQVMRKTTPGSYY